MGSTNKLRHFQSIVASPSSTQSQVAHPPMSHWLVA